MKNKLYRSLTSLTSLSLLTVVTGCGSMPTDSSVNHYVSQATSSASGARPNQVFAGPSNNASPEDIIKGFLQANADIQDDFSVARQYLTADMSASWSPETKTLIYDQTPVYAVGPSQSYSVQLHMTGRVDENGVASSYEGSNLETIDFKLVQVNGQWRISAAPQALFLTQSQFDSIFSPFTLYFYDPTYSYLVPDIRWLINRQSSVTSLVKALLVGPASYLQGAIVPASTAGISLAQNSVPVENKVATVNLGDKLASQLSQDEINRLEVELKHTLVGVLGVSSIQLFAGNINIAGSGNPSENFLVKTDQRLPMILQLGEQIAVKESLTGQEIYSFALAGVTSAAMDYSKKTLAVLNDKQTQLGFVNNQSGTVQWGLTAAGLARPSFDVEGWAWTADSSGNLWAVQGESTLQIKAEWLKGAKVTSISISRDGTRALISGVQNKETLTWVAGIVRDKDKRPVSLNSSVRVASGMDLSAWVSSDTMIVGTSVTGTVQTISLSGSRKALGKVDKLVQLSAGNGNQAFYAMTQGGAVLSWTGKSWSSTTLTNLNYLNFSG